MRLELQHVSIAIPPGRRNEARAFYRELLGLDERGVPPKLNPEELIWFRVGGDLELHLFESTEPAARSQHFCLRINCGLEGLRRRLGDAGIETHDTDEMVGRPRFFCRAPFGNRIELSEWRGPSTRGGGRR